MSSLGNIPTSSSNIVNREMAAAQETAQEANALTSAETGNESVAEENLMDAFVGGMEEAQTKDPAGETDGKTLAEHMKEGDHKNHPGDIASSIHGKEVSEHLHGGNPIHNRRQGFQAMLQDFIRSGSNKNYKLPENAMKHLFEELLDKESPEMRGLMTNSKDPIAIRLLKDKVMTAMQLHEGAIEPAQVDKVFEFLIAATAMTPDEMNSPEAGYLIAMRDGLEAARDIHYHDFDTDDGNSIDLAHKLVFPIAGKIAASKGLAFEDAGTDKESHHTAEVAKKITEWLHSPADPVGRFLKLKGEGMTVAQIKKQLKIELPQIRLALRDQQLEPAARHQIIIKGRECQDVGGAIHTFEKRESVVTMQAEEAGLPPRAAAAGR